MTLNLFTFYLLTGTIGRDEEKKKSSVKHMSIVDNRNTDGDLLSALAIQESVGLPSIEY